MRWCAGCIDPGLRRAYKMDSPFSLPPLLATAPIADAESVFDFDPGTQTAPGCSRFRGLRVIPDFLSPLESRELLVEIGKTPFAPAQSGKTKQHFGANFNFNKRKLNVSRFHGLPEYGLVLEARLVDAFRHTLDPSSADGKAMRCALANFDTTDLFVLRYQEREASNLDLHIDDTFAYGEAIFDVSLETDSVMTFVRAESPRHATHSIDPGASIECIRVTLQAGSAALLYGPARYEWEHGILHYDVRGQRTSITLRTLSDPLRNTEDGKRVLEVARSALPRGTEGAAPTAARPCSGGTEA